MLQMHIPSRPVVFKTYHTLFSTGFTSNGEYNSMRVNGYTRIISALKIMSDSQVKCFSMGKKMLIMLFPISK